MTGGVYLPFDRNSAGELAGLLAAIGAYAAGGVPALRSTAVPLRGCCSKGFDNSIRRTWKDA